MCLDPKRLGKQRVEAYQILNTLKGNSNGWIHHPAVKMWQGYEPALSAYGIAICSEWLSRGYRDTMLDSIFDLQEPSIEILPSWLFDPRLCSSHRASLLKKNFNWYRRFGWSDFFYGYFWPIS